MAAHQYFGLIVLFVINTINFLDRLSVAAVISDIKEYYKLSSGQTGFLLTCFLVGYILTAPIFGYLGEKYSRKWIVIGGISFWVLTAFSASLITPEYYLLFYLSRMLVGVGEASYSTIAPTLIADLFEPSKRKMALSLFYFAIPIGSGLGYLMGSLAQYLGDWRWIFRITPAIGIVATCLLGLLKEPVRGQSDCADNIDKSNVRENHRYLWRIKSYVWATAGFTCCLFATGAISWWAIEFMGVTHGKEYEKTATMIFGGIVCAAGFAGVTLGSLAAHDGRADPIVCSAGVFVAIPFIFFGLVYSKTTTSFSWVILFLAVTALSTNWAVVSDMLLSVTMPNKRDFATAKQMDNQSPYKPLPTPPQMPIIGHIYLMRDYKHNPWEGFNAIREKYGNIVGLKMGIHQMVLVSNVESMHEVLLRKGEIFSDRPTFPRHHIVFGGDKENSLALCNWSRTHRDRRKFCKRGVVPNKFSARNQLLESIICKSVVNFNENIVDKIVTKRDILFLTSDIFLEFLCNESYEHSDGEYEEFVHGCDFVFWDINQSYLIDFLPYLTKLGIGYLYLKKLKSVTDYLRDYIDDKIFEPRRTRHINKEFIASDESGTEYDYLDSIIIEHMSGHTSMSLADYKVGFADLLAGHAAVANILMRLLGHLALDLDTQNMICEEARRVRLEELDYRPSLPITEAALQEALRLASSPIVPHVAREDTVIDEFHVPKGTAVLFNNYYLNMSEDFWKDPRKYNPMRFVQAAVNDLGETTYKLNLPKHFMPFSVGLRQCLGYKMVETTSILMVANLCSKYVIRANNESLIERLLEPKGTVALDPDSECFELRLSQRNTQ